MKIVVNKCFGGWRVSRAVVDILRSKGYKIVVSTDDCGYDLDNDNFNIESDNYYAHRANKDLIDAIEEVSEQKAGGELSKLKIVEVPDGIEWGIDEHSGLETVHELHRSW